MLPIPYPAANAAYLLNMTIMKHLLTPNLLPPFRTTAMNMCVPFFYFILQLTHAAQMNVDDVTPMTPVRKRVRKTSLVEDDSPLSKRPKSYKVLVGDFTPRTARFAQDSKRVARQRAVTFNAYPDHEERAGFNMDTLHELALESVLATPEYIETLRRLKKDLPLMKQVATYVSLCYVLRLLLTFSGGLWPGCMYQHVHRQSSERRLQYLWHSGQSDCRSGKRACALAAREWTFQVRVHQHQSMCLALLGSCINSFRT